MPTFTVLRMELSSTKDRTLDLGFSRVPRLSQLKCKIFSHSDQLIQDIIFLSTDFVWAKAMGFTGAQIPDSDGVDVGKMI